MIRRLLGLKTERRRDRRYECRGVMLVHQGRRLPVIDISLGGVRAQCGTAPFHPGDRIGFALELPTPIRTLTAAGQAEVIRARSGEVALRYIGFDHHLMRLLYYFLNPRLTSAPPQPAAVSGWRPASPNQKA